MGCAPRHPRADRSLTQGSRSVHWHRTELGVAPPPSGSNFALRPIKINHRAKRLPGRELTKASVIEGGLRLRWVGVGMMVLVVPSVLHGGGVQRHHGRGAVAVPRLLLALGLAALRGRSVEGGHGSDGGGALWLLVHVVAVVGGLHLPQERGEI